MSIKKAEAFDSFLLIVKSDRVLRKLTNQTLREQGSVTLTEWLLLSIIAEGPKEGTRMSELAKELGVTLPQVTALLDSLLMKRLARQRTQKQDRRNRYAVITQRGEDTVRTLNTSMDELYGQLMRGIPTTHLQIHRQVLQVIASRGQEEADLPS